MPNSMSNKPGFYDDESSSSPSNHQTKQQSNLSGSNKEPSTKNAATKNLNQRFKHTKHKTI